MASTIQIKRGTGSAVPSGLADGELAINLDDGRFYFGSGSTSINSFRFTNLTADNYIVSSSVTNITTQTLSGSTEFGDDSLDTHNRTGSLNISGALNTDGNVQLDGTLTVGVDDTGYDVTLFGATANRKAVWDASQDQLKLYDNTKFALGTGASEVAFDFTIYHDGTDTIFQNNTGKLDISNSGGDTNIKNTGTNASINLILDASAPGATVNDGTVLISGSAEPGIRLDVRGEITASGNISSSGTIQVSNNGYFIGTQVPPVLSISSGRVRISGSNDITYDSADDHIFMSEGTIVAHGTCHQYMHLEKKNIIIMIVTLTHQSQNK